MLGMCVSSYTQNASFNAIKQLPLLINIQFINIKTEFLRQSKSRGVLLRLYIVYL